MHKFRFKTNESCSFCHIIIFNCSSCNIFVWISVMLKFFFNIIPWLFVFCQGHFSTNYSFASNAQTAIFFLLCSWRFCFADAITTKITNAVFVKFDQRANSLVCYWNVLKKSRIYYFNLMGEWKHHFEGKNTKYHWS